MLPGPGSGGCVDDGHLDSACPQRGGHLETDEAGTDDDDPASRARGLAERKRVAEGAQRANAFQIGAWNVELPRSRAGRDHEPLVRDVPPGAQGHGAGGEVERGGRHPQAELDVEVAEVFRRCDERVGRLGLTAEQLLGERRAMVGRMVFRGEQRDPVAASGVAVALCHPRCGQASSDDENLAHRIFIP